MRWKTISLILGCLAALLSACRGTPQPATTTTSTPHPHIAMYATRARVQSGKIIVVSASCQPGEQMVGGGFSTSNLFEYAAYIDGSYPSSATTWTVAASAPSSYFDVEAEVYCLSTTLPLHIQIVQARGAMSGQAVCQPPTVLLSGGAYSTQPLGVSYPQSDGWIGASHGVSIEVYALCAARHVQRSQVVTSRFNAQSSSHGYAPGGGGVACPAGQVATGGGFEGKVLILGSQANEPAFAGWSVAVGGDADVTITAVCWTLQG